MPSGTATEVSDLQFKNAEAPISLTVSFISNDVSDSQSVIALSSMVVSIPLTVMLSSDLQPQNTPVERDVTPSGRIISLSDVH